MRQQRFEEALRSIRARLGREKMPFGTADPEIRRLYAAIAAAHNIAAEILEETDRERRNSRG